MTKKADSRNVSQKLETTANISIVMTAVLFILCISWFFLRHSTSSYGSRSSIQKGTKIPFSNVDWSATRQTLLLVLSTHCKYCTASSAFYQRLLNRAKVTQNTRLIAIFPQAINESREYLAQQGVEIVTVQQLEPALLGIKGTPTLILVDADGSVIQSWEGMVPPEAESEVLASLK